MSQAADFVAVDELVHSLDHSVLCGQGVEEELRRLRLLELLLCPVPASQLLQEEDGVEGIVCGNARQQQGEWSGAGACDLGRRTLLAFLSQRE